MNAMLDVFSSPAWRHLTIALLHTLWQGPAVAAMVWLVLRWIPTHRAEARYAAAFAALIGLMVCGLATWSVLDLARPVGAPAVASGNVQHATSPGVGGLSQFSFDEHGTVPMNGTVEEDSAESRPAWLAWLTAGWLLGVALMAGRTAWTVARLRRLSRGPEVVDARIRQWADELRDLLRVTRSLRIVEAAEGFGPAVFGLVRPVLALPISMMTGLPPEVVRAVLAHELAHICRHDYWFNLVQMAIEAVLFFNPAVWWISRQIRIEREACCDAMAARLLGRPGRWPRRCRCGPGGFMRKVTLRPLLS